MDSNAPPPPSLIFSLFLYNKNKQPCMWRTADALVRCIITIRLIPDWFQSDNNPISFFYLRAHTHRPLTPALFICASQEPEKKDKVQPNKPTHDSISLIMTSTTSPKVVILGGGSFGLSMGCITAKKGIATTVLVRRREVSGVVNHPLQPSDFFCWTYLIEYMEMYT